MIWVVLLCIVVFAAGCFVGAFLVGIDDGYRMAKAALHTRIQLGLTDAAYGQARQRMLDADLKRRYERSRN